MGVYEVRVRSKQKQNEQETGDEGKDLKVDIA